MKIISKLVLVALLLGNIIGFVSAVDYDYNDVCRIDVGTTCPSNVTCCPSGQICRGRQLDSCTPAANYELLYNFKSDKDYANYDGLAGFFRDMCIGGVTFSTEKGENADQADRDECCTEENPQIVQSRSNDKYYCCPDTNGDGEVRLYGQYGDTKCCDGTPYGQAEGGNLYACCEDGEVYVEADGDQNCCESPDKVSGNICAECDTCASLHQTIESLLEEMGEYAAGQSSWPSDSEMASFQGPIASYYADFKEEGCLIYNNTFDCSSPDKETDNTEDTTIDVTSTDVGITCTKEQLIYGQCKLDVYKTLGIREDDDETSVGIFVQDIVLSATMFIGTVVTIAIVISGLMFVFGGANPSLQDKAKKGLINSIVGLVLVMSSYAVIRLVQFIVKGE